MKKPKNVLGPDYRVWHGLSDSFRQNVLLVINPHMGPLLAKSRASSFLRAVDSLLIFQQLPRSWPASFPESRHPPLNRMAPSLAAGEEETWESSWFCVFNFGSFFHVSCFLVYGCQCSHRIGSFFTLFTPSLTSSFNRYSPSTCSVLGAVLDSGDAAVDGIIMEFAF